VALPAVVLALAVAAPVRGAERFGATVTVHRGSCNSQLAPAAAAAAGGVVRVAFAEPCERSRFVLWRPGAPPSTIVRGDDAGGDPAIVVAPSGHGVVAWLQGFHLDLRARGFGPGGPRGPVRALDTLAGHAQAVGPTALAWGGGTATFGGALRVARVKGDRVEGVHRFDTPPKTDDTAVAVEPDGGILVALGAPRVAVERAPRGGAFDFGQNVSLDHGRSQDPVLAVARDGAALVAWRQSAGGTWRLAVAERVPGAMAFGPTRLLTPATVEVGGLRAAVTPAGRYVLAWQERAARLGTTTESGAIHVAFLGGRERTVTRRPGRVVAIGADDRGAATIIWQDAPAAGRALRSAVLDPGGRVRAVQRLSAPGERPAMPSASVAGDGGAVVAWITGDGHRVRVARR